MYFAGIDIGSRAAKGVIIQDGQIVSSYITDTGPESAKTSMKLIGECLSKAGLVQNDLSYSVSTGYGRVLVPFANENITEIACHAKGAYWYYPSVRTILDMGGQDCKAINCDKTGGVVRFVMSDKCAAGTGRFLEIIAEILQIPLERIGELSLESQKKIEFTTTCTVFAKGEALGFLRKGKAKNDILAGLHDALATRSFSLLSRISTEKDFAITGGIAKNIGIVKRLEEKVGLKTLITPEPLLIGAIGAALFAREKFQEKSK